MFLLRGLTLFSAWSIFSIVGTEGPAFRPRFGRGSLRECGQVGPVRVASAVPRRDRESCSGRCWHTHTRRRDSRLGHSAWAAEAVRGPGKRDQPIVLLARHDDVGFSLQMNGLHPVNPRRTWLDVRSSPPAVGRPLDTELQPVVSGADAVPAGQVGSPRLHAAHLRPMLQPPQQSDDTAFGSGGGGSRSPRPRWPSSDCDHCPILGELMRMSSLSSLD